LAAMAANGSLIEAEEFSRFNAGQAFAGHFFVCGS